MIYERWFTVKDSNGLDYLYYSDIRKTPFLNAVKHQNKAYKSRLEKRMNHLLKKDVSIELNFQNLIAGMPVSFTMYYRGLPIVEYCGNYMDLNGIRNEIFLIDEYDYDTDISVNREESKAEGIEIGIVKGMEKERCIVNKLIQRLMDDERYDDLRRSTIDRDFQNKLIEEYGITE